ncbi:MAG TPA: chemotaxis protein CheW [Tissierellales bacterium]|nr:chemotaxis protein CheW [Tissierellales bacterium]
MAFGIEEKYVIFKLDNRDYGLNIENVLSIEKMQECTKVPNAPSFIKGVINLRGEIVPIIDLKDKLGIGKIEIDSDTRVIIVSDEKNTVGLIVEYSSEILQINDNGINRPLVIEENNFNEYIKDIGKVNNRVIMIVDLEKLLKN